MSNSYIRKENLNNAQYTKHHTYEVAKNKTEAKYIANDIANAKRYAYRARVTLLGDASVRPYDPIYLDGLPNGMSGYWTVLSVKHIFNSIDVQYKMELEIGTDKIGEVNPNAATATVYRDVQAELAGQSLDPSGSTLVSIPASVNSTPLIPDYGVTSTTPAVTPAFDAVPASVSTDPYSYTYPTPVKSQDINKWVAL